MRLKYLPLALITLLTACSDSNDSFEQTSPEVPAPEPTLSAEITRTEYGIPHVKADDWASLGYGFGYAYAQDNFCVTMREIVFAIGRSAELIGEADGGSSESDLLFTYLNGDRDEFQRQFVDPLPQFAQDLANGYTRGMNRYLEETGLDNLPEGEMGCRNAEWVFPFEPLDLMLFLRREALRGSSDNGIFRRAILATEGPDSGMATATPATEQENARRALQQLGQQMRNVDRGSNGLALGRDITQAGNGILLGNPHQPWFGAGAWYQAHLTLPGQYDVAGAALHGFPFIGIGFNKDLAWTHTVSVANRFSLYELKLNPDNPLQYEYDGEFRDITEQRVTIKVKQADGSLVERSQTFYESHYGPIINLRDVSALLDGWPMFNGSVLAFRDANLLTGVRGIDQWINKGQATDMAGYVDAIGNIGNPVFHEIAADRHGDAFYGELSAIPFITQQQLDTCIEAPIGTLLASATTNVIVSLNGADSGCEWGVDPDAPEGSNLYGPGALPQFLTTDYVGNSNNSYWLSDANNPLEGFITIMGPVGFEGTQQFLRTRIGHLMVEDRRQGVDELGETPLFDTETVKGFMYNNRVYGAEVVLADLLTICEDPAASAVQQACGVLANWDQRVNLESRGAQVFKEFWDIIRRDLGNDFQNVVDSDTFWAVDFDPDAPLTTPRGIDLGLQVNRTRVIDALAEATVRLEGANVPLDAPWGEVQYLVRNNENVPIHGGQGTMGVYGAISSSLREGGYSNPTSGNSYIQVVTWDESECPIADVILVPSQSTDPASPHYADQTKLYSNKEWVRFPFCDDEIEAARIGETLLLEE